MERKTDQQALTDARAQLAQKEKDWQVREQKMRQDHQKTQELLAKNAGEAAQAQLTALDAQVKLLQSQNDALTKERDVAQNRSIEIERERDTKAARESLLEGMLTKEKSFGKAETKRADLAQEGEMNGRALSAYSKALIALVSEVFYERRVTREELWHRRNEFAEKFNRLSLENREILDAFSIPRTLQ